MSKEITKIKQEMVGYKYKHYKNGKIYLVLDIVIHTETQELMVVYRNINDEQIWCRPLSIFNEEIDNEHHKRFVKIDDDSDWKNQQEQAIFKEFEEMGYTIFYNGACVVLVSDFKKINIFTVGNAYSYTCCSTTPPTTNAYLTMKEHQLLHRLFEIWNWI